MRPPAAPLPTPVAAEQVFIARLTVAPWGAGGGWGAGGAAM